MVGVIQREYSGYHRRVFDAVDAVPAVVDCPSCSTGWVPGQRNVCMVRNYCWGMG